MGAEAAQQEAEGRVRAEKAGSEYRSRPLKAQMETQDYITTLKSLMQRNNFVSESRLNSSISSTTVLIQPFPSQHLRTASDRTKCGELRDCFSPQDLPHVKTADPWTNRLWTMWIHLHSDLFVASTRVPHSLCWLNLWTCKLTLSLPSHPDLIVHWWRVNVYVSIVLGDKLQLIWFWLHSDSSSTGLLKFPLWAFHLNNT